MPNSHDEAGRKLVERLRTADRRYPYVFGDDVIGEAADLLESLLPLLERGERLEQALREVIPATCDSVHHAKKDRHGLSEPCPVLRRAIAALAPPKEPT
jgi:hypothetical protein